MNQNILLNYKKNFILNSLSINLLKNERHNEALNELL